MRVFASPQEVAAVIGEEIGVSEWLTVSQERIARFAEVTGDAQWIHLDVERAGRESPYGATVAHGYLTLSLVPLLLRSVMRFEGVRASLNYGLNRVRFPAPVLAGARLRGRFRIRDAAETARAALRVTTEALVEIEHGERPACIAEVVAVHYW